MRSVLTLALVRFQFHALAAASSVDMFKVSRSRSSCSVSPFTALLAALKSPETISAADRSTVSSILFEGRTAATTAAYQQFVQRGLKVLQQEADQRCALRKGGAFPLEVLQQEADQHFLALRGKPAPVPCWAGCYEFVLRVPTLKEEDRPRRIKVSGEPKFVLEQDQMRKFFDTAFAFHYMEKRAFADDKDFDFGKKLAQLEAAVVEMLRARAGLPNDREPEWHQGEARAIALPLLRNQFNNSPDIQKGLWRILKLFFVQRTFAKDLQLGLQDIYHGGDWFNPRARDTAGDADVDVEWAYQKVRAVGCMQSTVLRSISRLGNLVAEKVRSSFFSGGGR